MTEKRRWIRGRLDMVLSHFSHIFSGVHFRTFASIIILTISATFFVCSIITLKAIPFLLLFWILGTIIIVTSNLGKRREIISMIRGAVYGLLTPPVLVSWAFRLRTDKRPFLNSGTPQSFRADIDQYFANIYFETLFADVLLLSVLIIASVMTGIFGINEKRLRARRLKGIEYSKKSFRQKVREGYIKSDVNRPIK